jgi:glutamate synthase domain-containing protein 2/glutamate synthase domain-containing protein 1/glutamate synthase domain-containing protein 3
MMASSAYSPDYDACGVGFVAKITGACSREIVERALIAVARLAHRGGVDADGSSGDGAGLLVPVPVEFFKDRAAAAGIALPKAFGVGMVFLPPGQEEHARRAIESAAQQAGLQVLGWRSVPINARCLGPRAAATLPVIAQAFVGSQDESADLEHLLFLMRKRAEAQSPQGTYFCSLSSRAIVYKGLLAPHQLPEFYADLASADFVAPFAVFHQRYSTNTRPSWSLAQPFRFVAHNGEINTIGANRRWLRAREARLRRVFAAEDWFSVLEHGGSDSASFDNGLEILLRQGHSASSAMWRMIPPANGALWGPEEGSPEAASAQFEPEQEAWDGPAALVFSDGRVVGAKLDRNGLRPLRYTITSDGLIVLGSEAGIADFDPRLIVERGRLGPNELILINPTEGTIRRSDQPLNTGSSCHAKANGVPARSPARVVAPNARPWCLETVEPQRVASALGWSADQYKLLFAPLGLEGKEAVWSMGDDAPLAVLSSQQRPLWDYCKQRFAQVTNPSIDPLRESHVMSLRVPLGSGAELPSPLLDAGQMAEIADGSLGSVSTLDLTYEANGSVESAEAVLAEIADCARDAVLAKTSVIIVSDRRVSAHRAALPILLGLAAVWKAIVENDGFDVPVLVESGQVIETHHVALLIEAGASAVYPYLAAELAESLKPCGAWNYRVAIEAGLSKVLARMGISTILSYRNSHLFEIVGLDAELCERFFEDATAVLSGKTLRGLLGDALARHTRAFASGAPELEDRGLYRFRRDGERHGYSPDLVRQIQSQAMSPVQQKCHTSPAQSGEDSKPPAVSVRDLLEIVLGKPIPLHEVSNEASILSRFSTQAMSLGALSPEAHRTLAIAMNLLGARSNSGAGGEDPDIYRHHPEASHRVKQVASARFGVTTEYLVSADELEIKMAQGAKPGEGGQLPAAKVTPYIARLRHAVPGMALISPPPHHDIYSIEDLAQLIYDLRSVNPRARIGVKLVSGAGVGVIAAGVAKAGADVITICGHDGGTGASPLTSIKNTGLPWEVGLREAHRALVATGLRQRVRLRADGGFKSARDVALASLLGADEFGFGTAALLAMGCVMARQCHLNTCPTGVATQDQALRKRFTGKPEAVMQYFQGIAADVRGQLAALGLRSLDASMGAVEKLRPRDSDAAKIVAGLLRPAPVADSVSSAPPPEDSQLNLALHLAAIRRGDRPARSRVFAVANSNRSLGARLSGEIARQPQDSLREGNPVNYEFHGSAGQSFGAFLVSGLRFRLRGEANDYVAKGLSGGVVAITAGRHASNRGDVLAGNTVLYGATSGELYIAGRAGERFAVRNSGALAVVEGVGQHGCEYMTAGIVVILGAAGLNLGAGMTGGLAYIQREFFHEDNYNNDFVQPAPISGEEEARLRHVLKEHARLTGSPRAARLLRNHSLLPLVRLQPVRLPCSIEETWSRTCARAEGPPEMEAAAAQIAPASA